MSLPILIRPSLIQVPVFPIKESRTLPTGTSKMRSAPTGLVLDVLIICKGGEKDIRLMS